jgi:hypothetical protein
MASSIFGNGKIDWYYMYNSVVTRIWTLIRREAYGHNTDIPSIKSCRVLKRPSIWFGTIASSPGTPIFFKGDKIMQGTWGWGYLNYLNVSQYACCCYPFQLQWHLRLLGSPFSLSLPLRQHLSTTLEQAL